ncbi:MAG: hypothetical protein BYD32DRAFT_91400 [Podila humilis]|nr:MAG: hypothetical protein BYD32DRAFT_91400 [Podila humilis]
MSNSVPCSWWGFSVWVSQYILGAALLDPSLHGPRDSSMLFRGIGFDTNATFVNAFVIEPHSNGHSTISLPSSSGHVHLEPRPHNLLRTCSVRSCWTIVSVTPS